MSSLDQSLIVEVLPKERAGLGVYRLTGDFTFDLTEFGEQGTVTVPKGYVTDFASIPRLFRWFFPIGGRVSKPALLHDQMCRVRDRRSTPVFNRAMKAAGIGAFFRWPMIAFVSVFTFPTLYLFSGE